MSFSLKKLLKLARRNRTSIETGSQASAAVPSSGIKFIDNSKGSSAAIAELSVALDSVFEEFDLDGELKPQIKLLLEGLEKEAAKYSNSQLKEEQCQTWSSTPEETRLIAMAWKCAEDSKSGLHDTPIKATWTFEDCTMTRDHFVTPTSDGTIKTVVFTTVSPKSSPVDSVPILVITIRASSKNVDHMVNLNGDLRDVKGFINSSLFLSHDSKATLKVHSGFLGCTVALDDLVANRIHIFKQKTGSDHVLFSGHSAGGAVASLLFLRSLSKYTDDSLRFSCITFGAPPTICSSFNATHVSSSSKGICLNMINEFDLIARVDKPYILTLVNLIRAMYNQPLLPGQTIHSPTLQSTTDSPQAHDKVPLQRNLKKASWDLPRAVFTHVGSRIVLRDRWEEEGVRLYAAEISNQEFEKLLFCGVAVHKGNMYGDRVRSLANGKFNGAESW